MPGSRSEALADPSPLAPVEPEATVPLAASLQSMVDAVPPSTCELTETERSVSGVLWKVTCSPAVEVVPLFPLQLAALSTVTDLSPSPL